jgi:hypothetical protein
MGRPGAPPLMELAARLKSRSRKVPPYWLAIPLCCWPFPQLCGLPLPALPRPEGRKRLLRVQRSSRVSGKPDLAWTPQCPAPLMDFRALQHIPTGEIHWSSRNPHLLLVRLQGLATLLAVFALTGLVSARRRPQHSWALPLRSIDFDVRSPFVTEAIGPHAVSLQI